MKFTSNIKNVALDALFGHWGKAEPLSDGYTIVLPSPMDMPFLLRYSLEGIRKIDTTHCRQILVVPDGWSDDGGAALREVVKQCDDPRIEMVDLRWLDYRKIRAMRPPGGAATHWMMVVNATRHARCQYAFLHDADAFFLDADGIERQYRECLERDMVALGVTARWDPFFEKIKYQIPGTWELMYSIPWARSRPPIALKGRRLMTPHGENTFDSMLYPQYLDYSSGRIGVMAEPHRFVHFNGTIFTYRIFRDRQGKPVVDELYRILLLAILEDLLPEPNGKRIVPRVSELAEGLSDEAAPVRYFIDHNYVEFKCMIDRLCMSPIFEGVRTQQIRESLLSFDLKLRPDTVSSERNDVGRMRVHGLR